MTILNKICLIFVIPLQIFWAEIIVLFRGQMALNNYIRKVTYPIHILKHFGAEIEDKATIWPGITINCENRKKYQHLKVGKNAYILWDVLIDLNDDVIIGDDVHIGAKSTLITHFSLGKSPLGITEYPYKKGKITIGNGSVVAWGCTVLYDTIVGEHTIVSSGSLVSGTIPPFCIYGGNPARPIQKIRPKNPKEFN